jgi:D,D-heptose 1,7-bisphosphate phosphatase
LKHHAVFLDRDGTINEEVGHLGDIERVNILPGSANAIRELNQAGFKTIIITNQAGVAREIFDEDAVKRVNKHVVSLLAGDGALIDAAYYCPHHPEFGNADYRKDCDCRKPKPGMLLQAAAELKIDLENSFIIGDTAKDIIAGKSVGCRAVLVLTGHGKRELESIPSDSSQSYPDFVAEDLPAAVRWVLDQTKSMVLQSC